jgi:hypothetical protein
MGKKKKMGFGEKLGLEVRPSPGPIFMIGGITPLAGHEGLVRN